MKPSLRARGTLKDVANAVGVSHTTVSNAFNRPDQLSPKLRETIVAAARSMSYSGPNPAARMLRTGFARAIAVVWTDPFQTFLLSGSTTVRHRGRAHNISRLSATKDSPL